MEVKIKKTIKDLPRAERPRKKRIRLLNRFKNGYFAEEYFRKKYFPGLGLSFRKIRKDKNGLKPDGWILKNQEKIALAEIKLIKFQTHLGIGRVTVDRTIKHSISQAKKQLKSILTHLPKLLYLIGDDVFVESVSILRALFGDWIIIERQGVGVIFSGYKGFHPNYFQHNKFRDNALSGAICYLLLDKGYELLVFQNQFASLIPVELLNKRNVKEWWVYAAYLKKVK